MAYVQKYYIYDPHVGDELGSIRIKTDDDGKHVLASPTWAQYWIDQGLMGTDPLTKLKEPQKKMLAQVTRGRSTNPDELPPRLPKYSKLSQSGMPRFALQSPLSAIAPQKKRRNPRKEARAEEDRRRDKTPQPKPADAPPNSAAIPVSRPGHAVT
jgi:hypothetical protein